MPGRRAPSRRRKGGRPSKYTPDNVRAILDGIRGGAVTAAAAVHAGISPRTVEGWLRKGRLGIRPYTDFVEKVEEASLVVLYEIDTSIYRKVVQDGKFALEYRSEFLRRQGMPDPNRDTSSLPTLPAAVERPVIMLSYEELKAIGQARIRQELGEDDLTDEQRASRARLVSDISGTGSPN